MLEKLIHFFTGPEQKKPLPEPDANLAMGALLVRVAKADDRVLVSELEQIDRILAARNGLNPLEAAQMRATCENLERALPETAEFARILRDAVSYTERRAIVVSLWQVALADGIKHEQETLLVDVIEDMLGVSADHSAEARAAATVIP